MNRNEAKVYIRLLYIQGFYFLITGIWPLVSIETFLAITGPKEDVWLIHVIGLLIIAIGSSMLTATRDKRRNLSTLILGLLSSFGLFLADVVFHYKGIISEVYLLDAVVEFGFFVFWVWLIYWYWIEKRFTEMVEEET